MVKGLISDIFDVFKGRPQGIGATYLSAALDTVSFIHDFVQVIDLDPLWFLVWKKAYEGAHDLKAA